MAIDLAKPLNLPAEFVARLSAIKSDCDNKHSFETLIDMPQVLQLARDINDYCMMEEIIGIHYTRAIYSDIHDNGLLIRNGAEIRSGFLTAHKSKFTKAEIAILTTAWRDYFCEMQSSGRDSRIFFNFTEAALQGSCAAKLIGLYGGEQVAMPFEFDDSIGTKLAQIGEPLLIRCALDPSKVTTFIEHPWGRILISAYHASINSSVFAADLDAYQAVPVLPEEIIEIRRLKN